MEYQYTNVHPKRKRDGDCVIRALAVAEGKTWLELYDELCAEGKKQLAMPNQPRTYGSYLKELGYEEHGEIKVDGRKARVYELPYKNAIVKTNRHLVAIKDGVLMDTWDSRYETIRKYYIKK